MMTLLKCHWPALLLALLMGVLTAFPQLIAEYRMGDAYQGVHPLVSDDEIYYLARAKETADGHPTLGHPYFAEHKDELGVQFWVPDYLIAKSSLLLFGDLRAGALLWDFLLPAAITLLAYSVMFLLTRSRITAFLAAVLLMPCSFFFAFNRSPNPQFFAVFLLAFVFLMRALETRKRVWGVATTLAGGALFYIYPFYWTYFVVLLGVMAVGAFFFLEDNKDSFKHVLAYLAGSIALGLPALLQLREASVLPYFAESVQRMGAIATHMPTGLAVTAYALLVGAGLAWGWRARIVPRTVKTLALGASVLGGAVVMNHHVVTGMNYFFGIHYGPLVAFMATLGAVFVVSSLIQKYVLSEKHRLWIYQGACVLLVAVAIAQLVPTLWRISTPQKSDLSAERYGPVFDWLNEHTEIDEVVLADTRLSDYIAAYTHNNVLFSSFGFVSYQPNEEIENRFLAHSYLEPEWSRETILESYNHIFGLNRIGEFQHAAVLNLVRTRFGLEPIAVERYDEARVEALRVKGEELRAGSFKDALQDYRVDYVVWDSVEDEMWRMARIPGLTKQFEANGVIVYALGP